MSSSGFGRYGQAGILLLPLLALLVPPAALAQDSSAPADSLSAPPPTQGTIGPPQLRNFELPGNKIVPARPQLTPPAITSPVPKITPSIPKVSTIVPTAPVQTRQTTPVETRSAEPPAPEAKRTQARPELAAPRVVAKSETESAGSPVETQAPLALAPPVAAVPLVDESTPATAAAFSWTYPLALALGAALLGGLLFLLMRNRRQRSTEFAIVDHGALELTVPLPPAEPLPPAPAVARPAQDQPAASPEPQAPEPILDPPSFLVRTAPSSEPEVRPIAAAASTAPAANGGVVGIQLRPWLELQFRPERATTTPAEASVQFELAVINKGNTVATKVRVEACMFNAGPQLEAEIEQFFAAASPPAASGMIPDISPRDAATLRSVVAMPKDLVREIEVNGRRLFIPTVAFNVIYEWGNGKKGRTSMAFLVGREPDTPSSKMSPFRLDQGPRIYRQVGQRPSQPAVLV
jgi:hypothetical protein